MRAGRVVLILFAVVFSLAAAAGGKLWFDMLWSDTSPLTPQALQRQGREAVGTGAKISPERLKMAERLARAELRFGPQSPSAWCWLAYIQYRQAGRLDAVSAQSLRRSYGFGAYVPSVFLWRTQFVFENWDVAPPDLRQAALREIRAFYSIWAHREPIEMMAARVRNPAGRLAVDLVLMNESPIPSG